MNNVAPIPRETELDPRTGISEEGSPLPSLITTREIYANFPPILSVSNRVFLIATLLLEEEIDVEKFSFSLRILLFFNCIWARSREWMYL